MIYEFWILIDIIHHWEQFFSFYWVSVKKDWKGSWSYISIWWSHQTYPKIQRRYAFALRNPHEAKAMESQHLFTMTKKMEDWKEKGAVMKRNRIYIEKTKAIYIHIGNMWHKRIPFWSIHRTKEPHLLPSLPPQTYLKKLKWIPI